MAAQPRLYQGHTPKSVRIVATYRLLHQGHTPKLLVAILPVPCIQLALGMNPSIFVLLFGSTLLKLFFYRSRVLKQVFLLR